MTVNDEEFLNRLSNYDIDREYIEQAHLYGDRRQITVDEFLAMIATKDQREVLLNLIWHAFIGGIKHTQNAFFLPKDKAEEQYTELLDVLNLRYTDEECLALQNIAALNYSCQIPESKLYGIDGIYEDDEQYLPKLWDKLAEEGIQEDKEIWIHGWEILIGLLQEALNKARTEGIAEGKAQAAEEAQQKPAE